MNAQDQKAIAESIAHLQLKGDIYTRQMIIEQRRLDELDGALLQARAGIEEYRLRTKAGAVDVLNLHRFTPNPAHQRADGLDPTKQADRNQRKLVDNLETRLNKLMIRQSEIENGSCKIKEDINHMRKERTTTNQVHSQYEAEIHEVRAQISSLMAHASSLNEQREELLKAAEDIITQNKEDNGRFQKRCDELTEFIEEQNGKFEESIGRATAQARNLGESLSSVSKAGSLTIEEEQAIREQVKIMEEVEAKEQKAAQTLEEKLQWYHKAFEELKAVSGIDDLDILVTVFMRQEEEHFSLFNFIQTVNQEIDQTLEKTEELQMEIKTYEKEQGVEEQQRVAIIRDLQERGEAQKAADEEWAQKVELAQEVAARLAKKAQSIFFKIQCDQYLQTAAKDATGERAAGLQSMASTLTGQGITASNILDYMSLIEQRSVQVIANYTRKLLAHDPESSLMSGPRRPPSWELPESRPYPDISGEESEGDEVTGERPLSLEETRKEIEERMERKVSEQKKRKKEREKRPQRG
ncbi:unnamed protein product, partial [Discosporangium mesarthrocarpum]